MKQWTKSNLSDDMVKWWKTVKVNLIPVFGCSVSTCVNQNEALYNMGGGNGQKAATARARNQAKTDAEKARESLCPKNGLRSSCFADKTSIIDESCQCALPGWWRRQGRVRSPALVWLSWSHNVFGWKDASLRLQKRQAKMDLKCASILKIGAHWSTCVQGDMFYCLGIAIEHQLRLCLHAVLPNHPGESSSGDYAVVFLAKCLPKLKSLGKRVARLKDRNCQTFKYRKTKHKLT